ncbi:hypothetical protein ELI_04980 [Erythrobacter litoralis HTCC2594]|uniref:Uncharacterized protein n=1 Tax=Erythrobacter litoralis (strain HTCC2594) TaxID=314225 RepID=Q2NB53_ERYLH|nr:hypothetical protein ELI_04980 [Erythrobacter litoralis HTCC2594]
MAELEDLDPDELDELLGLKPKFDIPPAARRSMERVGLLDRSEGGLPEAALARQPASLVRAALEGTRGPLVSRWGHILLRRALASRLQAPDGMSPIEFAGLRAQVLARMGEYEAARGISQDVDTGNWNATLADAAVTSYVATGDLIGACPLARFRADLREGTQWEMIRSICNAFAGETARARSNLIRMRRGDDTANIDVLLAQRYAGAAGRGRSAVNLEWDGVEELTPWRYGLATALGAEIPESLTDDLEPYYQRVSARLPMLPLSQRLPGAERAAREGILSSSALIDLYSRYYAESGLEGDFGQRAGQLRDGYVGAEPAIRLQAIRSVWGTGDNPDYARKVLTAYAAARIPANKDFAEDAAGLIAAMLSAGLDRDALEWGTVVPEGSEAWALLVLAQPNRGSPVDDGALDSFVGDDGSDEQRKSAFLVAGLAGLDRIDASTRDDYNQSLRLDLGRQSNWSRLISQAGDAQNQALVALLAGVGMQGEGWQRMTPRHLFHIVRALDRAGLSAEARMIAAEAVARA